MIAEADWVQEGVWGDDNTPQVTETIETPGGSVEVVYEKGFYQSTA